jgi:hypothetical protein
MSVACCPLQASYQLNDADYSGGDLEGGWVVAAQATAHASPLVVCIMSACLLPLLAALRTSYQLNDADYSGGELEGGWVVRLDHLLKQAPFFPTCLLLAALACCPADQLPGMTNC